MAYYSCAYLENGNCVFKPLMVDEGVMSVCCGEVLDHIPEIFLKETPEETLRVFLEMLRKMQAENVNLSHCEKHDAKRVFSETCQHCARFRKDDWHHDGLIHNINFDVYPSICQCRCFYCTVHEDYKLSDLYEEKTKLYYTKIFDTLAYAKENGLLAPNVYWDITCGEITIHPYKEKIYELVKDQYVTFFTNCISYDPRLAELLHNNPHARINFSIDAGTAETWNRVKRAGNFNKVVENITRYNDMFTVPHRIVLKYIIFPGINDSQEDFDSVAALASKLGVQYFDISRDTRIKYNAWDEEHDKLMKSAGRLVATFTKNNVIANMDHYSVEEREQIIKIAKNLQPEVEPLLRRKSSKGICNVCKK